MSQNANTNINTNIDDEKPPYPTPPSTPPPPAPAPAHNPISQIAPLAHFTQSHRSYIEDGFPEDETETKFYEQMWYIAKVVLTCMLIVAVAFGSFIAFVVLVERG